MNENIHPVGSELELKSVYIDKCSFERKGNLQIGGNGIQYEYNFNRTIEKHDDNNYRVSLQANITTKDTGLEIHARAVGAFFVSTTDSKKKNALISKNTMSILFPFVRSQIVLMTSQTDINAIVLPVVNVADMFAEMPLPGEEPAEGTET